MPRADATTIVVEPLFEAKHARLRPGEPAVLRFRATGPAGASVELHRHADPEDGPVRPGRPRAIRTRLRWRLEEAAARTLFNLRATLSPITAT
jgi:hypothetical protein